MKKRRENGWGDTSKWERGRNGGRRWDLRPKGMDGPGKDKSGRRGIKRKAREEERAGEQSIKPLSEERPKKSKKRGLKRFEEA